MHLYIYIYIYNSKVDCEYQNTRLLIKKLCTFFSACPPGKWGEDCGNECPCLNGAQCDPLSGDCTCTPGWHGNVDVMFNM